MAMNDSVNGSGGNGVNGVFQAVVRAVGVALGLFLLVVSIPFAVTPIPLGLPLFIASLVLLAATSKTAHRLITRYLRRHPGLWDRVSHIFERFHRD